VAENEPVAGELTGGFSLRGDRVAVRINCAAFADPNIARAERTRIDFI
jgi:hypothetical protein